MSMRRITFALTLGFLFMLPWEDSSVALGLGSLAKVLGMVLAAFWLVTLFIEGRFRKPHLFHFLVLLFFLWNAISVYWSLDASSTLQRITTYGQIFLIMLVFWDMFQSSSHLKAGLQAYVLGEYVLVAGTLYSYVNGIVAVAYEGRYSAPGVNANDLALSLILGMVVATHLLLAGGPGKWHTVRKFINLAYIPLAMYAVILTGTRTSLLAVIPLVLYIVMTPEIKLERKMVLGGVLLIAVLVLLPFVPQTLIARLGTTGSSIAGEDLGGRISIWHEAIAELAGHTLIGVGGGALPSLIGSAAHNTFISVATETGLIGFILFLAILEVATYQVIRLPLKQSAVWIALLMTWAIGALTLSWEFRKLTWILPNFLVIAGSTLLSEAQAEQTAASDSTEVSEVPAMHKTERKLQHTELRPKAG